MKFLGNVNKRHPNLAAIFTLSRNLPLGGRLLISLQCHATQRTRLFLKCGSRHQELGREL